MKNSDDTLGNQTCDLPICSAVPQPTVLPRAPLFKGRLYISARGGGAGSASCPSQVCGKVVLFYVAHTKSAGQVIRL